MQHHDCWWSYRRKQECANDRLSYSEGGIPVRPFFITGGRNDLRPKSFQEVKVNYSRSLRAAPSGKRQHESPQHFIKVRISTRNRKSLSVWPQNKTQSFILPHKKRQASATMFESMNHALTTETIKEEPECSLARRSRSLSLAGSNRCPPPVPVV